MVPFTKDSSASGRLPPAVLTAGAGLAQLLLSRPKPASRPARILAAGLAAGAGAVLADAGSRFLRHATSFDPLAVDRASVLVTSGVYGATRNPMYVGITGALLAHAALRRSWWAVLPAACFALLLDRQQIPAEERALRRLFGTEHEDYVSAVPRWLDGRSLRWVLRQVRGQGRCGPRAQKSCSPQGRTRF